MLEPMRPIAPINFASSCSTTDGRRDWRGGGVSKTAQLKLRAVGREEQLKRHLLIMLTVQTMNVVHSGYHRITL